MDQLVTEHGTQLTAIAGVTGCAVGAVLSIWSKRMCHALAVDHPDERSSPSAHGGVLGLMILTGLLFAAYFHLVLNLQAQLPDALWRYGRGIGHLVLISLLVVATATDLRDYIIPDQITWPGTAIGILLAVISGDTQIIHVWVDWNDPMTALHGPFIPTWIKEHRHWHGLAWSMAGIITGGGITWLIRWLSSLVLRQESLGFGDVTLMAMIGSFLGWQPVIFIIILAPLCAIFAGLAVRIVTGRNYIPFGPYLSLATVIVLLSWRWFWMLEGPSEFSIRKLFGDAVGLEILAGISVVSLILLLGCVRLYRLIPGRKRDDHD